MERCQTCGQTLEWHKEHKPRHPFSAPGQAHTLTNGRDEKKAEEGSRSIASGDPALRVALVNAGVIGYEDIVKAEEKLREGRPVFVSGPVETNSEAG